MYKPGGTIKTLLENISQHVYVLPAIQREFVWSAEQICCLFDSLMQGYPFGTMLFWNVNRENSHRFKFFDFVRTYHERDTPHCPRLEIMPDKPLIAVLDGQQRITALNIGLRGTYAEKVKWKWWSSPDAFPVKRLHLNLLGVSSLETGERYEFQFLEDQGTRLEDGKLWFPVPEILTMKGGLSILKWINEYSLSVEQQERAYGALDTLYRVVHSEQLISYYEETDQDIERVLSIFIRINSGGTKLSYSDLLLSIAVAQWHTLDAREEIHKLVDEMNAVGSRFNFSKDLVLKAGLMLANIGNVGFKVENFTHENMTVLEEKWREIRRALVLAAHLLSSFGFNGQVLRADSAILPIAYYLHFRQFGEGFLTANQYLDDRQAIRLWLVRTLLKQSGIWGSGLDTFLGQLREVIRSNGANGFPVDAIRTAMSKSGKSLTFESEELEEILDAEYGQPLTFAALSLLSPHLNFTHHFHVDHVYPKSLLTKKALNSLGFTDAETNPMLEMSNRLPNLQLLEGAANVEKQAQFPEKWTREHFTDAERPAYIERNLLGKLPNTAHEFVDFYRTRRDALKVKLKELLG
jgi:hypothetical protein